MAASPDVAALPPLVGTGAEFLDALALFLRTVPLYPPGHGRTEAVAARLEEVSARHGVDVEIEAAPDGLRVGSGLSDPKSPWTRAVLSALASTAISVVVFERATPRSSYVTFALRLHRNARLAATGNVTFADIWDEPIPGVRLCEQVYDHDLFLIADDSPAAPAGTGAPAPRSRRATTVARDVRDLVREHPQIGPLLGRLEHVVESRRGDDPPRGKLDLLEHVLRLLPLEARLDPTQGLRAVEGILERFAGLMLEASPDRTLRPHAAMLLRSVMAVFPRRARGAAGFPLPDASEGDGAAESALTFEDLAAMEDPVLPEGEATERGAAPAFDAETGIKDFAGLLAHVCLVEDPGERREVLRRRLVELLRERPEGSTTCVTTHLRDVVEQGEKRDLDRVRWLAGVLEDAGLDVAAATGGWLPLDVVVAMFPRLLRAFTRGGGVAGLVCRHVGRAAVLAAHEALLAPGGALADPRVVDRVLGERSRDVLPLLEVLLGTGDPEVRARVAYAMRSKALPGAAAASLRVVPEDRFTEGLLIGLCEDGFDGVDSGRYDATALSAVASVLSGPLALDDVNQRAYAAAALGAFPHDLAEPVLHSLFETRFLVPVQPREVRRVAKEVLRRFEDVGAGRDPA